MDRTNEEQMWELTTNVSRSDRDRRHSSSASSSSQSTEDRQGSQISNGRRTRPSVGSISSQLPTVREQKERRALSWEVENRQTATPRLGSDETVVSSKKVLTEFRKVASRDPEGEKRRLEKLERYRAENQDQRDVYNRLKDWADSQVETTKGIIPRWLYSRGKKTSLPKTEELLTLARHYYPPRGELRVHVCDFGQGHAEHTEITLGQIEEYWQVKPEWVDVRWIHAPLGLGLTHSSVEDIFLHDGSPGRGFENAGRSGWPYLETEILNFRSQGNFQEMRDVYLFLKSLKDFQEPLNDCAWDGDENANLHSDIDWRADHLGMDATYWNLVDSDMPWQLTEGIAMGNQGPVEGLRPIGRHIDKQALSSHPFFEKSQLVRNPFRCFHRSDGYLLTLSPMAGVNYLDKNMAQHLDDPIDLIFDNDNASAVGHFFQAFAEQGTTSWHRRTVEWFLVYLITEVGVTPHNLRQGCNAPSIESAYQSVIQDLKRRRYDPWKRNETVKLVREYLSCVDELTTVKLILHKKLELFQALLLDAKKFEVEDFRARNEPNNATGESSQERVVWALGMVKAQHDCFERLLIDLKQSMNALFQLRSIEQNELAIVNDSQNKAIFVFTGVTIVFLPLSFFTSYYGMNLSGIVGTSKTEAFFWKICGTAGFLIVLIVALGAFRHRLRRLFNPHRFHYQSMV